MRARVLAAVLLLAAGAVASVSVPSSAYFVETFDDSWESRWTRSSALKHSDGEELKYEGVWAVEEPSVYPDGTGDKGLVMKSAARLHAISAKLPTPITDFGTEFVVQYEVKTQDGLECGGAYLKLISASSDFSPSSFGGDTPYTIMFGPDRCGPSDRVHFILRHLNPLTNQYEEKLLDAPPRTPSTKTSTLYTLVVRGDNTAEIFINGESARSGSLFDMFSPPVNPPATIDDPTDSKPATWEDEPRVRDPAARKPDDWDESQPAELPDMTATKPEGWLDDEPLYVADPEVAKPDDWIDEDDGEWEAPVVANPRCEIGCGEWKRPTVRNPLYKGKWLAPYIDNPKYVGPWKAKQIANPDYYHDDAPHKMTPIGAIGFELWTMQGDILFDNIFIGSSLADARAFAEATWRPRHDIEAGLEAAAEGVVGPWGFAYAELKAFAGEVFVDPIGAAKRHVGAATVAVVMPLLIGLIVVLMRTTGGDGLVRPARDRRVAEEEKEEEEEEEEEVEEEKDEKEKKND